MSSSSASHPSTSPGSAAGPAATIHVDLDGAQEIYEGHGWGYTRSDDRVFDTGMRYFLDFFSANDLRATLFVIARSVRDKNKRALLDEAVRAGHEIASHSLTHEYLPPLELAGKRRQIAESRDLLQQELGVPVAGFRAPGYRIDRASIELLAECGYEWDSSAFPTAQNARALNIEVETLAKPHRPVAGSDFVEWPMPDHRPFPLPFNPSYSLVLGDWLFRGGLRRFRAGGRPLSLLFHLIDLAEPLPDDQLRGVSSKIFTLSHLSATAKRARCQGMIDQVRGLYRICTTGDAIAEWRISSAGASDSLPLPSPRDARVHGR